jgi:transposase
MLTVEDYEKIRKAVKIQGMSERQASRKFGHSRKTVKKALEHSVPPGYAKRSSPAGTVVMNDIYRRIVDKLLEKNKKIPRKQRMTGTKIHQILVEQYDFTGCVQTVRRYIAAAELRCKEVFFKLDFQPGAEAQVDWGEAMVVMNGVEVKVHLFCMRLPYSRTSFVRAYPSQKMECFLDGHVWAFEFFGGVARRCAYDNLKSAVIKVGKGKDRKLNKKFLELRSHYLFDSRFCNVASGNEKGHAENLVKKAQRDFLSPPPHVIDFDELNRQLDQQCLDELKKEVKELSRSRGELLEEERENFIPLPRHRYQPCIVRTTYATKQSLVEHECNHYSVPVRWAYHDIVVKAYVDRIDLCHNDELIASHKRCWEKDKYFLDYMHFIPLLETKPGGIHNSTAFIGQPWGEDFEKLKTELEYRYEGEGIRKFINVLFLFHHFDPQQVKAAVKTCVAQRAFNDEAVMNVLSYQPDALRKSMDVSQRPKLKIKTNGIRKADEYDRLLSKKITNINEGSFRYGQQHFA